MAMEGIPLQVGNTNYEIRTRLGGSDFLLRFLYQARDCRWYFDVSDADGVAISSGVRIVANEFLLDTVTDARRPLGEIIVLDMPTIGSDGTLIAAPRDPGKDDFGGRHKMYFIPYADLA